MDTTKAVSWKEGENYFSQCLDFGVASCGDTADHAFEMLREACRVAIERLTAYRSETIPVGTLLEIIKQAGVYKEKFMKIPRFNWAAFLLCLFSSASYSETQPLPHLQELHLSVQ